MLAKIIVSINAKQIDREFDYLIPDELIPKIKIGDKVEFPFGKSNKLKTGYVIEISDDEFSKYELKYLTNIIDTGIGIPKRTIKIAKFIHETYGSTIIQALKTVIPVKKAIRKRNSLNINNALPILPTDITLADEQKKIIDTIQGDIDSGLSEKYLIHGVTGSGKTQVFIELAKSLVKEGKKVIVLIPEISLTYQMVRRFVDNFGERVGIIHSKLSQGEKYEQIEKAQNDEIDIMIGPRSALFTPFNNLGCIIIDEEHESSYKSEMSPKYDTREVAEYMNKEFSIPLIFSSATPSIETYHKTKNNDIKLFEMKNRRGNSILPEVKIVDMREEVHQGNFGLFSQELLAEISKCLYNNEQIILFVCRRGYSNYISCMNCGYTFECEHCDITYTYHRNENMLKCHYCGSVKQAPTKCSQCGSMHLDKIGFGTQKVEEELNKIFPDNIILRMDQDTTSTKNSHEKILEKFHKHKADILVGTQMIIKGHDFPDVGLVGIINIDPILSLGSFRAAEKTFQTIVQASGRAGRREKSSKAIIQTYQPDNYAIKNAIKNDYKTFYEMEIGYRNVMQYPPIRDFLKIIIASKNIELLELITNRLKKYITELQKEDMSILGPTNEKIFRLNDIFRKTIHIKGDKRVIRYFIKVCDYLLMNDDAFRNIHISYEINADL